MEQTIDSVKTVEVAELPLLRLDIQYFSNDLPDDIVDNPVDDLDIDPVDNFDQGDDDLGDDNQDLADPDVIPPPQDDKANAAFAQMRREKEAAEQRIKSMDALISQQYGDSHGIHTFEEYQRAVEEAKQEEERQRYVDAGLPDEVIDKLSKADQALAQAEEDKFNRLLSDNYLDLQKEYPEMVKAPDDIKDEVWQKWNGGNNGISLTDAYELVNKKAIREHLQASSKQSTLNKINSKNHVRANGGEGADDVDLTSVPSETMAMYRQMFSKELKSGKMKETDFVKHYKKSL